MCSSFSLITKTQEKSHIDSASTGEAVGSRSLTASVYGNTSDTATAVEAPPFRVVYLNGLAQTDDEVAMREVVQQLGITGPQGSAYSRCSA